MKKANKKLGLFRGLTAIMALLLTVSFVANIIANMNSSYIDEDYLYAIQTDGSYKKMASSTITRFNYINSIETFYVYYEYNDSTGLRRAKCYVSPPTFVDKKTGEAVKVKKIYFVSSTTYKDKKGDIAYSNVCSGDVPNGASVISMTCAFNKPVYFGFTSYDSYRAFGTHRIYSYFTLENGETIDFGTLSYYTETYRIESSYSTMSYNSNTKHNYFLSLVGMKVSS